MLIACTFKKDILQWILCNSFFVASPSFDLNTNVTPHILQDLGEGFPFCLTFNFSMNKIRNKPTV